MAKGKGDKLHFMAKCLGKFKNIHYLCKRNYSFYKQLAILLKTIKKTRKQQYNGTK